MRFRLANNELPGGRTVDCVTRASIQRFEKMLAGNLDKGRILEGLLAEQKTELKAFVQINKALEVGGNARLN